MPSGHWRRRRRSWQARMPPCHGRRSTCFASWVGAGLRKNSTPKPDLSQLSAPVGVNRGQNQHLLCILHVATGDGQRPSRKTGNAAGLNRKGGVSISRVGCSERVAICIHCLHSIEINDGAIPTKLHSARGATTTNGPKGRHEVATRAAEPATVIFAILGEPGSRSPP